MYDLAEVRVRLDQMTGRIISRLKDRSRFPANPAVYRPDGVPIAGRSGISFLEFSLEGLENYHASLGRFAFPDQYPLLKKEHDASPAQRTIETDATPRIEISITGDLVPFYIRMVDELCAPGDDPGTFGETVYVDADLLNLIHERINIGRHIAAAKAGSNPELEAIIDDSDALSEALRDRAREAVLLSSVEATAVRYELDPVIARRVFEWIVDETLALEVWYLQGMAKEAGLSALRA
ncbi:MAG: chorismate mutase [Tepidiformaceae bacterium]